MINTSSVQGGFQFPQVQGFIPASSREELDQAVKTLQEHKNEWAACSVKERIAFIDKLIHDFYAVMPRLVAAEIKAKGYGDDAFPTGVEWASQLGVLRNLRGLRRSLVGIDRHRSPSIPGRVTTRPNGQVTAQVFPETVYDRIFFSGYSMDVWMEPDVKLDTLTRTQALVYQQDPVEGCVALVLGAGNVSALASGDTLYKLFVEKQVVVLKMNPVNEYAGPFIDEGFRALVQAGFLRVVYGGAAEGAFLCNHDGVDEIHVTGSDKTFDAIVFGAGAEGKLCKDGHQPATNKRVTGELGNIAPVIIVPGAWNASEIDYQAEKLISWMVGNTGFVCYGPHVLFTDASWPQREQFLNIIRAKLSNVPLHKAYYPGTQVRQQAFVSAHPQAELFGHPANDEVPWTLIPSVSIENAEDICFTTEPFCGLMTEIPIRAANVPQFIEQAVNCANEKLWGTLNAGLFVHPASLKDPAIAAAVDAAIANLRYGNISINTQAGALWFFQTAPWGGISGQDIYDVQSGIGFVHNTLMFSRAQKVVLRAPFVEIPKSIAVVSQGQVGRKVMPQLAALEASPSLWKVLAIIVTVLGG